jgi:hypothetical protein
MNYHFDHKVIEEMFWTYSSNSFQLSGGVFFLYNQSYKTTSQKTPLAIQVCKTVIVDDADRRLAGRAFLHPYHLPSRVVIASRVDNMRYVDRVLDPPFPCRGRLVLVQGTDGTVRVTVRATVTVTVRV